MIARFIDIHFTPLVYVMVQTLAVFQRIEFLEE